jgi:hypothetical protein
VPQQQGRAQARGRSGVPRVIHVRWHDSRRHIIKGNV